MTPQHMHSAKYSRTIVPRCCGAATADDDEALDKVFESLLAAFGRDIIPLVERFLSDEDARSKLRPPGEEQSLDGTAVHEEFKAAVEKPLVAVIEESGLSEQDFYETAQKYVAGDSAGAGGGRGGGGKHAGNLSIFLTLLLSSTDFQLFAEVMTDEAKRSYYLRTLRAWKGAFESRKK